MKALIFLSLASLSTADPGMLPVLPVNPRLILQQAVSPLEARWGKGHYVRSGSSETISWQQSWFGLSEHTSVYLLTPEQRVQSISLYPESCQEAETRVSLYLGTADQAGLSPQYTNSWRYARWSREGVEFLLEDFGPGCRLELYLDPDAKNKKLVGG